MAYPTSFATTVAPTTELVTDAELRAYLGLPPSSSGIGAELPRMLGAATELLDGPESITAHCWRQRTLNVTYVGDWPDVRNVPIGAVAGDWGDVVGYLWLPGPVPTTPAVDYIDEVGGMVNHADSEHWVLQDGKRWWLALKEAPMDYGGRIMVSYQTTAETIPAGLELMVMAMVSDMWTHRGAVAMGDYQPTPTQRAIMSRYSRAARVV